MWLPVLKPSKNHKPRIRKIYFIYRYRLGNKNSRHLFLVHFCMSLLWHPCHNSVIQNQKSPTGTQWLQKLTFWKKETPAKPQQQAFSITATINDTQTHLKTEKLQKAGKMLGRKQKQTKSALTFRLIVNVIMEELERESEKSNVRAFTVSIGDPVKWDSNPGTLATWFLMSRQAKNQKSLPHT